VVGSVSRSGALIWMTQISSGAVSASSRTGGFCEKRPSQYVPPSRCTARKMVGMAADARTASAVIVSRRLLNVRNSPLRTSTAPMSSIASSGRTPSAAGSTWRSSMARKSSRPRSLNGMSYGLTAGATTNWLAALAHSPQAFSSRSCGAVAALSVQKPSSSRPARAGSPSTSAAQASVAHTAPPDVPLRPTTSYSSSRSGCSSRWRTPAVNAVWLPPPWQAMATRGRAGGVTGDRSRGGRAR
jgi:hypothetical protein